MDENQGENVLGELNPQIDQGDNQSQHGHDQNQPRTLRDYMNPTRTGAPSCIVFPPEASRFNFKPGIIQLLPTFHGLESENPFKELLNICPHHGFETWRLVTYCYEGLIPQSRQVVEMMCNGEFRDKNPEDALDYLDQLAENAQHWDTVGTFELTNKQQSSPSSGVTLSINQTHIHRLIILVGEIIRISVGGIEKGKFPAQPQLNPKIQQNPPTDQVKSVITLRSGKVVDRPMPEPYENDENSKGRPFLATANALINCRNGLMNLSFGNMTLELNVFNMCRQPNDENENKDDTDEQKELFESCKMPLQWNAQEKKKFFVEVKKFYWDDPYLFKYCPDQIFRRCIPDNEVSSVINFCHSEACGGHFSSRKTTAKILQCGFYWPTMFKDTYEFCKSCEKCQKLGSITKRNMMPLNPILEIEIFDCWGIDFMGPFPSSFGFVYILVAVDYVSKWIEAISCRNNDSKTVVKFLRENILSRFGIPRAIISDGGKHFCNKSFESLMKKYGITHKIATPY
ncbi:uncharacterized protein LOC112099781, partial [Citrus clementina]|uniref:uncharacterized protein LOC112099781 n=1 Tax=Citrus clementina TaxID=85681 RepID=UPI000CED37C2